MANDQDADKELIPDPDALKAWEAMPKNTPSKQAMPPAVGGTRWLWGLLIIFGILAVIALLLQGNVF